MEVKVEWNGVRWNGVEWRGDEWGGVEVKVEVEVEVEVEWSARRTINDKNVVKITRRN